MKKNLLSAIYTLLLLTLYSTVGAVTYTFNNASNDNLWSNSANWLAPDGAPPPMLAVGDIIIIDAAANLDIDYTLASGAFLTVNSNKIFRITNGDTFTNNGTVTINVNGEILNRNIIINNGVINNNGILTNNAGSIVNNSSTGTINNAGTFNQNGTFTNSGTYTGGAPLPIELLTFGGKQVGETIELEWKTLTEVENAYMEVERSRDGIRFELIGAEKAYGNGNSLVLQTYHFTDKKPLPGVNYYRLRQYDKNGKDEYHFIAPVTFKGKTSAESIRLYPTEVKNELNITWDEALTAKGTLYVTDIAGRILQQQNLPIGTEQHQLNATQLAQGHYFISLQDGRTVQTVRFVKL